VTLAHILGASGFFGGVQDFFDSPAWHITEKLLIFSLFLFWLALAYWVYKDARRRIEDPWLVWMSVILGLVPLVGVFIYVLLRPPEYLDDVRERELEIKEMEARLGRRELQCPVCRAEIERDFLVCPVCTTKLRQACVTCKAPLESLWQICPFCETPVAPTAPTLVADSWETPRPRLRGPSQQ
jgi:heme exporter protein D/RNA polymerase subunit RPABC4/transcription elongation factor Spt4